MVIGEHSLFFIDHLTGEMIMQRRLEYKSTAVCSCVGKPSRPAE